MAGMKLSRNKIILSFALLLTGIGPIAFYWHPLQAQITELADNPVENSRVQFKAKEPPPNDSPGNREGSGTHGSCQIADSETDRKPMIALVPEYKVGAQTYVKGKTTVSNPTFWLYLLYSSKTYIEFVLYNQEDDLVYEADSLVEIEGMPGVISFQLPSEVKLELGKNYRWFFNLYCDRGEASRDNFVQGWVQRVSLSSELQNQLEAANPLERIALLAQNGIWYDPLTALAQLRDRNPDDETIANAWNDLLKSVALEDISQEDIQTQIPE